MSFTTSMLLKREPDCELSKKKVLDPAGSRLGFLCKYGQHHDMEPVIETRETFTVKPLSRFPDSLKSSIRAIDLSVAKRIVNVFLLCGCQRAVSNICSKNRVRGSSRRRTCPVTKSREFCIPAEVQERGARVTRAVANKCTGDNADRRRVRCND